jgi:uncharacterized RmlC-like cupin family protein
MSDVIIIHQADRDASTAQTPGMVRVAGVAAATCGAAGVWMGEVVTEPGFESGAHHHGDAESAIYVVRGTIRFRWGERLQYTAEGGAGDFIFVPPNVVHTEANTSQSDPLVLIVARGGQENVVVNVEVPVDN